MAGDEPRPADEPRATEPEVPEEMTGGDPACWAGFVCMECGAMISEGHRAGCSGAPDPR